MNEEICEEEDKLISSQILKKEKRSSSSKLRFKDEIQLVNFKTDCEPIRKLKISFSNNNSFACEYSTSSPGLPSIKIETTSSDPNLNKENDYDDDDDDDTEYSYRAIEIDDDLKPPPMSCLIRRGSMDCLIMRKYQRDYYLKDEQYSLLKEYFGIYSNDELIDRNLFESHLIKYALAGRRELRVKNSDIKNALDVIDSDSNYFIDFNEFLDFLTLFFASKYNLKKKIISVLNGHQYSHSQAGYLSSDEANTQYSFLAKFYNVPDDLVDFEADYVSYKEFADCVYSNLEKYVFVRHNLT